MNTQFTNPPKPTFVNVIAWMTLASGVVNLFWGLGLSLTGLLSIIGIICIPFMLLPTILGVFEIIYAAKLMSNPPQTTQPSTTIAILEIVSASGGQLFLGGCRHPGIGLLQRCDREGLLRPLEWGRASRVCSTCPSRPDR